MSTRRTFFILDGHALAYRHHFAMMKRPFKTASGEVTSAVYGFARTLLDILGRDRPEYLAVAFDDGLSGRDMLYSDYKGTREKMPDDLVTQMVRLHQMVDAFNIPRLTLPGYEADDLIGTVALQAEAQGLDIVILTGDRDLLQLLTDHTRVKLAIPVSKTPDELYDTARFRERYSLEPHQLIDLKALEGDTSDNIPGVAGVGEKTATTLLQTYRDIEDIYANLDAIGGSVRKKLEAGREMAFLSKKLATIQRDVPVVLDVQTCTAMDFDPAPVESLFRELEFTSLLTALDRIKPRPAAGNGPVSAPPGAGGQLSLFDVEAVPVEAPPPGEPLVPFVTVQDEAALTALVAKLETADAIAFDTETTSTDQMLAALVGISLAVDEETGYYIPVGHQNGQQLPLQTVLDAIRPAMTNPNIPKIAHNAIYDLVVLQRHGIDVTPITLDTMLASWVHDTFTAELALKRLVRDKLNLSMTTIDTLIGKGKNQITMDAVAIEGAAPYAAADAVCTQRLAPLLLADLDGIPRPAVDPLWGTENPPTPRDVLEKLEMPLVPVLASMQRTGIMLDVPALREMSGRLGTLIAALETEIYDLTGGYGPFNINSPKQLNDVLFGKLGLSASGIRKTSHGFSTAADVLDEMRGLHPIVEKILEYRELTKLRGTYVDALPALINPATNRVHTSYNQAGAGTGRLSSSNPNLQNIPIRTEIGREVRRAFVAPPGYVLLSVDYSQVELRIMAHISQDATLLDAFAQGQDIHAATAAILYGVPIEQVAKTMRIFAKRVNFGILYGMGAFRLARDSQLTLPQAREFIDTYFARLPGVKSYLDRAKSLATDPGFLTTLFGRRRSFPGMGEASHNARAAAEREAINMPIQGTAADIMKKAMIEVHAALANNPLGARMLLQVHDELVLEVPEARAAEAAALIANLMENTAELRAPLKANAAIGVNWRDVEALG
ncbi:MAG: DNA polymerase I [Chloroflexi bacterium]|nr:DNA polymerase I [Chloroflexota bacterium]